MRALLCLLFLATCGVPLPLIYGADGGVIGHCRPEADWCVIDLPDGGTQCVGAP